MPTYRLVESAGAVTQLLAGFKMCFLNVLRLHVSQTQRQKRLYKQYMEQLAGAYVERCTDLNTMHWDPRYNYRGSTPEWRYSQSCDERWCESDTTRSCCCSECTDSGRCSSPCCSEVIFNGGQHFSGKIPGQHVCRQFPVCYPGHFGYLSTGDSFRTIAFSYRIGESTVANIITEVCDALWKHLQPKVLSEPTQDTWKHIARDFKEKCQFDHCCGAIDGKHVTVKAPPNSGSDYYNYKKNFSLVLLAVADANRKFTVIDVGSKGRFSDGGIFSQSEFGKRLHAGQLRLPEDEPLTPGGLNMPYVFVGDEAFPLLSNLMRVYPKDMLSKSRRIFNYRLCRARRIVENAFGVLSSRWRVYKRPLECRVDMVDKIIKATCVLHNYFIEKRIDKYFNVSRDRNLRQVGNNQLTPLEPTEITYLNENFFIREEFCRYFNTVGAVSWQDTRIRNRLNI